MENVRENALKLVKDKIALAGSVSQQNAPAIKAMLVAKREGMKTFYFASNVGSVRAKQYKNNPKACLYFFKRMIYKGVMLEGTMEVLTDQYHRNLIWNRSMEKAYRSGGVNDPDYCVLKFTAASGRYYYMFESESFDIDG